MQDKRRGLHVWLMTNILLILFSPLQMELAGGKKQILSEHEKQNSPRGVLKFAGRKRVSPVSLFALVLDGKGENSLSCLLENAQADPTVHRWFAISQQKHYLPTQSENLPPSLSCVDEATRKGLQERSRPHFIWNEWATRSSVLKSSSFQDKGCL